MPLPQEPRDCDVHGFSAEGHFRPFDVEAGPLVLGRYGGGRGGAMNDKSPPRLLLEGRPGIGKTTVTRRLTTLLRAAGVPLGGFVSDEIRVGGRRVGFTVEAVSGDRGVL